MTVFKIYKSWGVEGSGLRFVLTQLEDKHEPKNVVPKELI